MVCNIKHFGTLWHCFGFIFGFWFSVWVRSWFVFLFLLFSFRWNQRIRNRKNEFIDIERVCTLSFTFCWLKRDQIFRRHWTRIYWTFVEIESIQRAVCLYCLSVRLLWATWMALKEIAIVCNQQYYYVCSIVITKKNGIQSIYLPISMHIYLVNRATTKPNSLRKCCISTCFSIIFINRLFAFVISLFLFYFKMFSNSFFSIFAIIQFLFYRNIFVVVVVFFFVWILFWVLNNRQTRDKKNTQRNEQEE